MKPRDPKPEIQRLEELVASVRFGEIRLPKFQRPFIWKRPDMLNLLDSIYNGYPIGSILLWHSSERLKSERAIVGFQVNTTNIENYPTNYLLDGQQRLTTLCGALYWEGTDISSRWRIFFDLDSQKFTYAKDPIGVNLFPLNRLIKTSDFIKQCMKFEQSEKSKEYYEIAEKLLQSIKDYKIAVVRIGDIALTEVAPIFERINSTGRKLTMVDLMRAATWKDGFDLTQAIDQITLTIASAGFGEITESSILRSISAATGLGINKEDIRKLRDCNASELQNATENVNISILKALTFLKTNASMDDISFLPYGLQLTHLSEFFRLNPTPSKEDQEILIKWFWVSSATRQFAGSSTGQIAKDLNIMREFATNNINSFVSPKILDITQFLFDQFNLGNASSTAFALILKAQHPRETIFGTPILETQIKEKERSVFDDLLKRGYHIKNRNICQIINPEKNKGKNRIDRFRLISSQDLPNNLLNDECLYLLNNGMFGEFIACRSKLLSDLLNKLTEIPCAYSFPK